MLTSLNHITIAVCNLDKSFDFYVNLLGMKPHAKWEAGAYLTLADLWFCLSLGETHPSRDYSDMAFSIQQEDFELMQNKLNRSDVKTWKENSSEGASNYFLDPDGHKLEIHVGSLQSRLTSI